MAAEGEEITIHRLHINLEVRCALGAVYQYWDAMSMSHSDDVLHWIHRTQYIADMSHRDNLRALCHQRLQLIQAKDALIGNGNMFHDNPPLHRLKLPGDDIRVMLHLSDDHLVAWLHLTLAERGCHQIDSLRRTTGKHNLLYLLGIDKLAHFLSGCLMQISCLL